MTDDNTIHGIDDTVRVAIGFVMGGFTAVHFDLGLLHVAVLAAAIVFLELIYGFVSAWYVAYQHSKENSS